MSQILCPRRSDLRRVALLFALPVLLGSFAAVDPAPSYGESPTRTDGRRALVGHWPLRGDCRDYSGHNHHGVNHGVDLDRGQFDGVRAYIEIPAAKSLQLAAGDFTLCAWIHTDRQIDDVVGDVLDLYDPALRRGVTLSVNSSASGYLSQGGDRHVYFGIDNARTSPWQDCGRPSPASNYVSNSMTVFEGRLYAGVGGAKDPKDWCHVFRYEGGEKWTDCGRVGSGKTTGIGPLIVHNGQLYAVASTYDWTRVHSGDYEPARVYRYAGGKQWVDCGQPSDNRTLNCAATYQGKLYVGGGPSTWGVFVYDGDQRWSESIVFPKSGPRRCFPHAMGCYNGKLYVAFPSAYAFDGREWTYAGVPSPPEAKLQTHSFAVYQGRLCAGTWPLARVAVYRGGEDWQDIGQVGEDGTEVNSLVVYNGKLYGGSLPRSEVCRYDGRPNWTSLKRFYSPEGWTPVPPGENGGNATTEDLNEWSRLTSMTVYRGRLFASTGSCTSSVLDAPCDVRGKVFSMEAGKCISYDDELHPGWRHLAAVRQGGRLRLYVDGRCVAQSTAFDPAQYDITTDRPLQIGFGQSDYFRGRISDVRVYRSALPEPDILRLSAHSPLPAE